MSDKNKNRKTRLTAFFRYHKDELSGEERNSFERDLQKDPFTEEASEGFKSILPESADEDISELDSRLKTRTSGRKSFILYRIAATVAILVAITSIFIIIERNRTSKQIAVNTLQPPVLEISRSEPITEAEVKSIPLKKQSINEKRKSDKLEVRSVGAAATISEEQSKVNPAPDKKAYNNVTTQLAEAEKKDKLSDLLSDTVVSEIAEDRISAPAGAVPRERSLKKVENDISGYIPPQPVTGKSEFDRYLKENIHHPDSLTNKGEEVTLSFIVRRDGSLDRIKIVSSPGKLFSDEAIRLIKSGPAWKPAEHLGKQVEDRVKVKIEFR
jgi:protein TonB